MAGTESPIGFDVEGGYLGNIDAFGDGVDKGVQRVEFLSQGDM